MSGGVKRFQVLDRFVDGRKNAVRLARAGFDKVLLDAMTHHRQQRIEVTGNIENDDRFSMKTELAPDDASRHGPSPVVDWISSTDIGTSSVAATVRPRRPSRMRVRPA